MNKNLKIVTAITGASGSIYAKLFLEKALTLSDIDKDFLSLVISDSGKEVADYELGNGWTTNLNIKEYSNKSFFAPFASGSSEYDALVVIPCSMGTLGRIASGTSEDLISRAADVMLKERKKLILVIREMPYNLIHIKNMEIISLAGGIILPANPSFYSHPQSINELVMTVVDRVFDNLKIVHDYKRWALNK
ncbi:MAG TPA: UbiX family flavin prenyltransferase [Bacteroidales bacterium]|jgi:4-hydroxy-3-polyprenylbenzoate decarboxylase|nr:UbiX family flavin prenyltransferase [Bacteroidales bacterium]MDD4235949.1 UbiX family flavin prenyltransferase [Bacteroidales bacterium]HRW21804.1 UbiX family flavin prenyltransferase [Bacteroidales bacterium]HXK81546.1 UbiX family flavin prenyltransferase [Bacteroidales bacterium]